MDSYTVLLDEYIDNSEDELLDILNNNGEYQFLSFSEALKRQLKEILGVDEEEVLGTFKQRAKDKDISFDRNTLNNWLNKGGPKKSDDAREKLYKMAFTLDLDIYKTKELFEKVYRDRAFNLRKIDEFIYYIFLRDHKTYQQAQELIAKTSSIEDNDLGFITYTKKIFEDIKYIVSDEEIIDYISKHRHSFAINNVSAKRVLEELIMSVKIKSNEVDMIKKGILEDGCSAMAKDIDYMQRHSYDQEEIILKNHSMTSNTTMLGVIYNVYFEDLRKEGSSFKKESTLSKEIIKSLPVKHTFSKSDPTYEELRKMIILLGSYRYWVNIQLEMEKYGLNDDSFYNEYKIELNDILQDANMPLLYPGNSFDWLFMYCTKQAYIKEVSPLILFRDLLGDSMEF